MSIVSDAIVVGAYIAGSVGAAALIGVSLIGQAVEENSSVIIADAQVASVTLDIDTLSAMLPPCEHEDTTPTEYACLWDSSARGNNEGTSFIVQSDGSVVYLSE